MDILTNKFDAQLTLVRKVSRKNGLKTPGINRLSTWLKQHYADYLRENNTELANNNRSYYQVMEEVYNDIEKQLSVAKENDWKKVINLNYPFLRLNCVFL